ncbi:MAG: ccmC [Myxococcales bacterium]|jgi:heme exporter protein C|nr:ccmC [Myxococcales bacterium]
MRALGPGFVAALLVAAVGFLVVPGLILAAPLEPVMGFVQKIFYFHVPCASMMFLSTFACAAGSLGYLFKGSEKGDQIAAAAGELGVLFGACTLVTGPLWGRKAWGVYWQWDARLTTSLLLFLILIGYMLARRYGGPGGRKLSAALALFAAVDVPLVYKSVDFWRTVHPQTTVVPKLDPHMRPAFWSSMLLITLVWSVLLTLRVRIEALRAELATLKLDAEDLIEARLEARS